MAAKTPKKFSARKGPLKSQRIEKSLKKQHYEQGGEE